MRNLKFIRYFVFILLISYSCNNEKGIASGNDVNGNDSTKTGAKTGEVLPAWQEGYLDIDAINTGRGESTFFIFPDGTTMLVDAGASLISPSNPIPPPPQKPDSNTSPGSAITAFVKYFVPKNNDKLDYMLLSHFHVDHMGGYSTALPMAPAGDFRMSGITEVGAKIPVGVIIDRGYPNYDYPVDMKEVNTVAHTPDEVKNYIKFINWAKRSYGAKAEQFKVGSDRQISLKINPAKYNDFVIRNIVANGRVWTGKGDSSINTFPGDLSELLAAKPTENIFSDGFQLSYGKFDYFSAGDLQYNGKSTYPWLDIETAVSKVMGPVDVMKADHHGTANTDGSALLDKLDPQAVVVDVWRDIQPNPETVSRFYAANPGCNIFLTNLSDANKERLNTFMPRIKSTNGHIVVRVAPGGSEYMVYVLDDTNEKYEIKEVFGPYKSK